MPDARSLTLERIRKTADRAPSDREGEYASIPREYLIIGTLDGTQRLELFADRLRDYGCGVYDCADTEIAGAIAHILTGRRKQRLLIPAQLSARWLPEAFEFLRDDGLTALEIDAAEGVVTGCALAIASTGTIVLRHTPQDGRRAVTLIPDYHLCVVFERQVVETVSEGMRRIASFDPVPLTMISGPSATSDIEMTRVKGVHGPRTLDVIVVSAPDRTARQS